MDVRLMGKVEIRERASAIVLSRAGERCVLACLALEPGRRVPVDALVDRLWGDDPPANAGHTIASYVRTVRRAIADAGGQRWWLRNRRPAAYQLDLDRNLVDYHRFTALVGQARVCQRDGEPAAAVPLYERALALRTSESLGGIGGQWADNRRYGMEQEYLDAACALYEQQLAIGDHGAVATHATALALDVVPTDRLIALAIHGLARSGRHAVIPDFLSLATRHLWERAQVRLGAEVLAMARQLVDKPNAALQAPPPPVEPAPPRPSDHDPGSARRPPVDGGEPLPRTPIADSQVTLIATHNGRVYQSRRDQYISGE